MQQLGRNVINENGRKMKSLEAYLIERELFVPIPGIDCHSYIG